MTQFNDIGISSRLDWPRIRKLLTIGLAASLLHTAGDMLLGWGVEDESLMGFSRMLSAYTGTSDGGILAAAWLGLFGMTLAGLSMFGIYRLMAERAPSCAHSFRSGIFGYLIFGVCGFHVSVCALVFLIKHGAEAALVETYIDYFLLPPLVLFWIFFLVLEAAQIRAFAKGLTPCPRWCWIFSLPVGMAAAQLPKLLGNHPLPNAIACAWIPLANLWMFAGLLAVTKREQKK